MSDNRAKMTFVATITSLLIAGFLITSLASFSVARKALRSEIRENELPLTSDNVYSEIQRDLIRPIVISSLMAGDTFVRDWVLDGEKDETRMTRYLKEIQKKHAMYSAFFVSEKSSIYYHADGVLKKVSPDEPRDEWYYRARDMKDNYEINIDPDLANKDILTIFINHRVFDYDGNFIGATGVGLTENAVLDLIEIYQAKYDRAVYFYDQQGSIRLAGSKFDPSITNISQFENAEQYQKSLDKDKETSFSYSRDGHTIHVNIRFIEEWGWFLAVEKADERAVHGVWSVLMLSLVICGLMTVVISAMLNKSITRYQKRIEILSGVVPICSHCDKVRDNNGNWSSVESFVSRHTEAEFSHSICPDCMADLYPDSESK